MTVAVSNTTPLIGLAHIGQFDLLRSTFDIVYISPTLNLDDSLYRLKAVGFRISDSLIEKLLSNQSPD